VSETSDNPNHSDDGQNPQHLADLALAQRVLAEAGASADAAESSGALDEFVTRMGCVPRILATVNARRGRPLGRDELADLAQDTLILLWKKLHTFEGRATLETWAWRFCFLEFSNRVRKVGRRGPLLEDLGSEVPPEAVAPTTTHPMEYEPLYQGLERLGDPEAEIIRLKHFEDLTFEELAERLNISPNTAKTRYYRGLGRLREDLGPRLGELAS
jgi:RNA polymerase sigma-70 factor (ECF subfamily)